MPNIDWDIVNRHLTCPICGEKAYISPETDGTEGSHTHTFTISREYAEVLTLKFGKPTVEDLMKRIDELEGQIKRLIAGGTLK